jgi:hypothetical protein
MVSYEALAKPLTRPLAVLKPGSKCSFTTCKLRSPIFALLENTSVILQAPHMIMPPRRADAEPVNLSANVRPWLNVPL